MLAVAAAGVVAAGCSAEALPSRDDSVTDVVASTPVVADLARNVAGERARVTQLVPDGADPHAYELSLRDVRNVANADLALTNGLLLEQQSLLRAVDSGVRDGVPVVALAQQAEGYGGYLIPLVEDVGLDTVWLGLRVHGAPAEVGEFSQVRLEFTSVDGPGEMAAYLTGTFGTPQRYLDSSEGVDPEKHRVTLPPDAHTHMSWAFTEPGVYRLGVRATVLDESGEPAGSVGEKTVTFAVGTNPYEAGIDSPSVLDGGHYDLTVNLDDEVMELRGDSLDEGDSGVDVGFPLEDTVVSVPNSALQEIPPDPAFRFIGRPGDEVYLLAQAVLGRHVHGEIDPHLWHDVANAKAYVEAIRDNLIGVDPDGAQEYVANAEAYLAKLDEVDAEFQETIEQIPEGKRQLVTTHDGYRYLSSGYGVDIAGFVAPNPSVEPSARDMIALTRALQNLEVPAVFLEPTLATRANTLKELAGRLDVDVCRIYGDTFDEEEPTYLDMVRYNARSLDDCLGGAGP